MWSLPIFTPRRRLEILLTSSPCARLAADDPLGSMLSRRRAGGGGPVFAPRLPTTGGEAWLSKCTYTGRWREMVHRSALALKLLTFEPTGAIVAAPTCSLPESIGGERNWDYRYTWIRDAAFTSTVCCGSVSRRKPPAFMEWLESALPRTRRPDRLPCRSSYGIDGRHDLTEQTLDHLEGYRGSGPVRIGNGAYRQLQLDIYGELMDSVYLYNKYVDADLLRAWVHLRSLLDWLCDNWQREDEGIWEVRGGRQHFVYSKLMCWVALDRGLRLADKRSFPRRSGALARGAGRIYEEVMPGAGVTNRQAFVQPTARDRLDASNLIMPLVFFMSPTDPRMLRTVEAIIAAPAAGDLVCRQPRLSLRLRDRRDGLDRRGRDLQHVHVLAGRGSHPRRTQAIRRGWTRPG